MLTTHQGPPAWETAAPSWPLSASSDPDACPHALVLLSRPRGTSVNPTRRLSSCSGLCRQ